MSVAVVTWCYLIELILNVAVFQPQFLESFPLEVLDVLIHLLVVVRCDVREVNVLRDQAFINAAPQHVLNPEGVPGTKGYRGLHFHR